MIRGFFILVCVLFLAGCATTREFPQPTAAWKTYSGQLRYSNPKRSIIGEFVVRTNQPGQFQLEFLAGPGVPLISLKQEGERTKATGPLSYGGRWRSWARLRERFQALSRGARQLKVEDPGTGERFLFLLNQ